MSGGVDEKSSTFAGSYVISSRVGATAGSYGSKKKRYHNINQLEKSQDYKPKNLFSLSPRVMPGFADNRCHYAPSERQALRSVTPFMCNARPLFLPTLRY